MMAALMVACPNTALANPVVETETKTGVVVDEGIKLTNEELNILYIIIMGEARGEGLEGQMAVAEVIKNRSELWGMDVLSVCYASGQFYKGYRGVISEEVKTAVKLIFEDNMSVFDEQKPTHFHSGTTKPYWAYSMNYVKQIGGHYFYA